MAGIDYSKLRSLVARDLCRALEQDGFALTRQTGSHQRYYHTDGRRVTVATTRKGGTFAAGTLKSIIEIQARWTEDDLRRLGLLS
jgi:predicted RNA binding protein YcfA (HicA-like mRNA interferase family)